MINFLRNIVFGSKYRSEIILGRWGNSGKEIKNIYANHDHCGDIICKNPKDIKKIIKRIKI